MFKLTHEKYFEFGFTPDVSMILSGWEPECKLFLGIIPIIIYFKPMNHE